MNCQEIRSELPAAPLGLIDDRRDLIEAHITDCPSCAARSAALERGYRDLAAPLPPRPRDPEALWARIDAVLDDPSYDAGAPVEADQAPRPDIHIALSCAYCHDGLARIEARYCASCLTPHHGDCFREHGRCAALACEEVQTVRPSIEVGPAPTPRRSRVGAVFKAAVGLSLVGGISIAAYVGSTQLRATQQAFRDELVAQRAALTDAIKAQGAAASERGETRREVPVKREAILNQFEPADYRKRRAEAVSLSFDEKPLPSFPSGSITVGEALDWLYEKQHLLLFAPPEISERSFELSIKEPRAEAVIRDLCRQLGLRPEFSRQLPFGVLRRVQTINADRDQGLREVLSEAGRAAGQQVIFFGVNSGASPARFQGVGWDEVFSTFAKTRGLSFAKKGGVIVASGTPLNWGFPLDTAPRVSYEDRAVGDYNTVFFGETPKNKWLRRIEGRRDLAGWVSFINEAMAGSDGHVPVSIEGEAPKGELRLTSGVYDVRDALLALAMLTGLDLREDGERLVFAPRPTYEGAVYRAFGVGSDVWLLALAEQVGETNVVFDAARPRLTLSLEGVSARSALEASALSAGLRVEKRGSILQVYEEQLGFARIGDSGRGGVPFMVTSGEEGRLQTQRRCELEGVMIPGGSKASRAFISGEVYQVGDTLEFGDYKARPRVEAIDEEGITLSNPAGPSPAHRRLRIKFR